MDTDQLLAVYNEAKYYHEHGAFTALVQGEFFKRMDAAIAAPEPEPPPIAPPPVVNT